MPRFLPKLRRLLASGCTLAAAGRQCGISRSAAGRWIARYGMDAGRRIEKPRLTPEQTLTIWRLKQRGESIRRIAAIVKVSRHSVRRHCKTSGVRRCASCGGLTYHADCLVCDLRSGM